ncbi:DNA gyrase subunit A [Achromatium sp. WMS1]|nr:DNA gyrase subunit A [Achromatium sp. WMS1]
MADFAKEILVVNLEDEMRRSYLDYAMSVIVGRALPDVRDGLKPVHRRVLFAMGELGNDWNKPYKKSARIVGSVIGQYHPHGDTAVYDTIVRMAQPFSMRYMPVDGQGNFGSIDGDSPAAMRYTEIRLARIAHELLADLDRDTVDFIPNYDESEKEPTVLPAKIPNLLINGSTGIAVGMATNIPPHNLGEVVDACVALIDTPEMSIQDLMQYLPGPDFPTAAIINGAAGIHEAYHTGRGRIYLRAKARVVDDDKQKREVIIIDELPYQVNKAKLLERIGELIKERKFDEISEVRDESDKDGLRVVIELKRGEMGEVVLNNLYQHTQLQTVFGINILALVDGQPRTLNLAQVLHYFLRHRREVVTRRTLFELRKARERAHVLEGLAVALANLDPIIALIKAAATPAIAKTELLTTIWQPGIIANLLARTGVEHAKPDTLPAECGLHADGYHLSEAQVQAILDLRLHRLTGLEQNKILQEFEELLTKIRGLLDILASPDNLMQVIRNELLDLRTQYGDPRRTIIEKTQHDLAMEDLITSEDMVVTLSHAGYVKAQPISQYQAQRRGGKGKVATAIKNEDFIDKLLIANTHDTILCFSSHGKVYWLKVYDLPQAGRNARGRPMVNLLPIDTDERINAVLPVHEYQEDLFVFMATRAGTVKKTPLKDFSRPLSRGIIALNLRENDQLVGVALTNGQCEVMLFASNGKVVRFEESQVRATRRTTTGVRGMRLATGTEVITLMIVGPGSILMATANGYGKRTAIDQFAARRRGGQGVIGIRTSKRNGAQVGAVLVQEDDEIMLISSGGALVRTKVTDVRLMGRATHGVKLINLTDQEQLAGLARIVSENTDTDDGDQVDDTNQETID